jgi:hypothetical protein
MLRQIVMGIANASRLRVVQVVSALVLLPATSAALHAAGLSSEVDTGTLSSGLFERSLWITLGMAALFGAIGGVVAELIGLRGRVELPHHVKGGAGAKHVDTRHEIDLGIVSKMLLGAAAALALLAIYAPANPISLLVNALIAGSAATGVFRLVQHRMLASPQAPAPRIQVSAGAATLSIVGGTGGANAQTAKRAEG